MPLLTTCSRSEGEPIARQPDAKRDLVGQLLRQLLILFIVTLSLLQPPFIIYQLL